MNNEDLDQVSTRISGIETALSMLVSELITTHGGTPKAEVAVRALENRLGRIERELARARQFAKKRLELV